jgi:hypothetical protein
LTIRYRFSRPQAICRPRSPVFVHDCYDCFISTQRNPKRYRNRQQVRRKPHRSGYTQWLEREIADGLDDLDKGRKRRADSIWGDLGID